MKNASKKSLNSYYILLLNDDDDDVLERLREI